MKSGALAIAVLAIASPATAQQKMDPRAEAYRAMLGWATDTAAAMNASIAALQEQVKALTAERDKLKAEAGKAAP